MTATQEFIDFVLNHPGYFHISKSKVFLAILEYLADGAKSSLKVYENFKNLDTVDIDKILETLFVVGLLQKHLTAAGTFFYCTDDAKELLEKVKKTKEELLLVQTA